MKLAKQILVSIAAPWLLLTATGCQSNLDGPFRTSDQPGQSSSEAAPEQLGAGIEKASVALEPSQVELTGGAASVGTDGGLGSQAESRQVAVSEARVEQILSELNSQKTSEGILINLPENILFDFDKAEIKPDAKPTLAKINELIGHYSNAPIAIYGHTDSKGSDAYNQTLSAKRANAVKNYLVSSHSVDASRLQAQGFGETKPIAPNTQSSGADNPAGRQQNRRVEVIIRNQ